MTQGKSEGFPFQAFSHLDWDVFEMPNEDCRAIPIGSEDIPSNGFFSAPIFSLKSLCKNSGSPIFKQKYVMKSPNKGMENRFAPQRT
ncbi:hypothetical protein P872_09710 [Rhodonellum psychrophilum GCM71 = DSM 17998]|uniref:Uncharacterized protein n=1 Tax=Rhodonellum psychrophilum GCM71 = DSM 17998 TaxID=1123057 RepID=U5C061_9BACT|nr:hypothetical protein P872_09710 [Rhodonellum psychrophilum GCM71 = DSM 17998]